VTTNLLFISTYMGIGGGENLQLNLMRALDPAKYTLYLVTPQSGPFPQAAAAQGVSTHSIPFRGTSTFFVPSLWSWLPIVQKLAYFLREQEIHAVLSDYHSLPFIIPAAEELGIPVIWNAMGWWFPIHSWQRKFSTNGLIGSSPLPEQSRHACCTSRRSSRRTRLTC
jgi:hypothetical protein